jgi:hypothetical protein
MRLLQQVVVVAMLLMYMMMTMLLMLLLLLLPLMMTTQLSPYVAISFTPSTLTGTVPCTKPQPAAMRCLLRALRASAAVWHFCHVTDVPHWRSLFAGVMQRV